MKVIVNKKDLVETLSAIKKNIPVRPSHPILGCIRLSSHNNMLIIHSYDLSTEIKVALNCVVITHSEKPFYLSYQSFSKLLGKGKGDVTISFNENELSIIDKTSRSLTLEKIEDIIEYPETENPVWSDKFKVKLFLNALNKVLPFYAKKHTSNVLETVHFSNVSGQVCIAATNSLRLSTTSLNCGINRELNCNVSGVEIGKLAALLKNSDEIITMAVSEKSLWIKSNKIYFKTRLYDGGDSYPNYTPLLYTPDGSATLNRKDFFETVGEIKELSTVIKIDFNKETSTIKCSSISIQGADPNLNCKIYYYGEYTRELPVDLELLSSVTVILNAVFLYEALACCDENVIELHLGEKTIKIISGDFTHIIGKIKVVGDQKVSIQ